MALRFVVERLDKGALTPQGFLKAPANFTRTGVFTYYKADGSKIRELRHPDDVFKKDSLDTLSMAPVTDKHPSKMVDNENFEQHAVGYVGENIKQDGKFVTGTLVVAKKKTIEKIDKGTVQLSCGYHADLVDEKGTYDGEEYDVRQTNIRYNHVAVLDRGRAGPQVKIRLDGEAELIEDHEDPTKEDTLKKIKINGVEFEVTQAVADAFEAHVKSMETEQKSKTDALQTKLDTAEKSLKEAGNAGKTEIDKLQAKVDGLEEKLKEKKDGLSADEIQKLVKARNRIEGVAKSVLGDDTKLDGTDMEIMKAVLAKKSPNLDLKDKSDVYITARFDGIADEAADYDKRRHQLGPKLVADSRKDAEFDSKAAREKASNEAKDAYKQPTAAVKK